MKKFVKVLLIYFVSIVIVSAIIFRYQYNNDINNVALREQGILELSFINITHTYKKNAQMLYATVVNTNEVVDIFHKAVISVNDLDKNHYRQMLLQELKHSYLLLKPYDIKQLHFHLKDNESFLRFHKPSKFGDNLTDIRPSVVYVNKNHKMICGFEIGKIHTGYRFVFPISYKNTHIGSVEISISMKAILDSIKENGDSEVALIIDKNIVDKRIFKSEKETYQISKILPQYFYENENFTNSIVDIERAFTNYKKANINNLKSLDHGKTFSFITNENNLYRITTFLAIKDATTNETIAYIINSKNNNDIKKIKNYYILIYAISLFILLLIFIGIYKVKKSEIKAKDATKAKSMFLANMSHEIRTPMNAIIGFGDILNKSSLTEAQEKNLGFIRASASSLLNIINDVLDFSKIEAGKLELEQKPFFMYELNNNLHGIFSVLAKDKNIEFTSKYESSYKKAVVGDQTRIGQILINLVNNAIKFTKEGLVSVEINTVIENDKNIVYEIKVKDTGIGIEQVNVSKLFNSFTQADLSTNRKFGGTGLGLSITKTLVTMMDGDIKVNSIYTKGSEFIATIRLEKDENFIEEKKDEEIIDENLSSLRILVAEDNKTNQILIDIILDEYDIEATIVNDGQEAIDVLTKDDFDLILMDIQMPNVDGYEATKIIRDKKSSVLNHDICIYALSANALKDDIDESLKTGMDGHIAKPIDTQILYKVLQQNLKRKQRNG